MIGARTTSAKPLSGRRDVCGLGPPEGAFVGQIRVDTFAAGFGPVSAHPNGASRRVLRPSEYRNEYRRHPAGRCCYPSSRSPSLQQPSPSILRRCYDPCRAKRATFHSGPAIRRPSGRVGYRAAGRVSLRRGNAGAACSSQSRANRSCALSVRGFAGLLRGDEARCERGEEGAPASALRGRRSGEPTLSRRGSSQRMRQGAAPCAVCRCFPVRSSPRPLPRRDDSHPDSDHVSGGPARGCGRPAGSESGVYSSDLRRLISGFEHGGSNEARGRRAPAGGRPGKGR